MNVEQLPLARQVDLVFKQIRDELLLLPSGIIFMQIRGDAVGKFGIRHDPIEIREGDFCKPDATLTEYHYAALRQMGIQSLQYKRHWTHGEITLEFAIRNGRLIASVQFESNYNMANLVAEHRQAKANRVY